MSQEIKTVESEKANLGDIFPAGEHGIYCYFGRIGNGKTYALTADIIEALMQGQIVYVNYPINWEGFDERKHLPALVFSLLGLKNNFYEFDKTNLKSIEVDENFHDKISRLTDCIVALDEGYVAFDSYEMAKMSMSKRKNVLHTRHFNRSIWYTTQRVNAVHVTLRAQTNIFYKVEKIWNLFFTIFRRLELDLGADDSVDEENVFSRKLYFGKKKIFRAYDTKYLRKGMQASQKVNVKVHSISYENRLKIFWRLLKNFISTRDLD